MEIDADEVFAELLRAPPRKRHGKSSKDPFAMVPLWWIEQAARAAETPRAFVLVWLSRLVSVSQCTRTCCDTPSAARRSPPRAFVRQSRCCHASRMHRRRPTPAGTGRRAPMTASILARCRLTSGTATC